VKQHSMVVSWQGHWMFPTALAKQCVVIRIFIVDLLLKSNLRLIITTVLLSYGILYFFISPNSWDMESFLLLIPTFLLVLDCKTNYRWLSSIFSRETVVQSFLRNVPQYFGYIAGDKRKLINNFVENKFYLHV